MTMSFDSVLVDGSSVLSIIRKICDMKSLKFVGNLSPN